MNLDQYFCFHTMKEKDVPDCHLAYLEYCKLIISLYNDIWTNLLT